MDEITHTDEASAAVRLSYEAEARFAGAAYERMVAAQIALFEAMEALPLYMPHFDAGDYAWSLGNQYAGYCKGCEEMRGV